MQVLIVQHAGTEQARRNRQLLYLQGPWSNSQCHDMTPVKQGRHMVPSLPPPPHTHNPQSVVKDGVGELKIVCGAICSVYGDQGLIRSLFRSPRFSSLTSQNYFVHGPFLILSHFQSQNQCISRSHWHSKRFKQTFLVFAEVTVITMPQQVVDFFLTNGYLVATAYTPFWN